jgi:hypothetical protein
VSDPSAAARTPSFSMVSVTQSVACATVMRQVDAELCRSTFVVPSRATQPSTACTSPGNPPTSPTTRVATPADRSTERAPASSVVRSTSR